MYLLSRERFCSFACDFHVLYDRFPGFSLPLSFALYFCPAVFVLYIISASDSVCILIVSFFLFVISAGEHHAVEPERASSTH